MNAQVITNEDFSKKVQLLEEAKKKQTHKSKIINKRTGGEKKSSEKNLTKGKKMLK